MSIIVSEEPFIVVRANDHLIEQHYKEVVVDGRVMDIHWDYFDNLEKNGSLVTIVARSKGEVVGYAVFMLQYHLHNRTLITGHNDAVFVRKDKRTRAGAMILIAAEAILISKGVKMIFWHVKPAVDFGSALLKLGYSVHESVYIKHVGDK